MPSPNDAELRPQPGPQERFAASAADVVIYGGSAGGGKMLRVDEPIPTPSGWTTMGELQVGDSIFDERGIPCSVIAVHPIDPDPESYRLTFDDGTQIEACAGHLWLTFDAAQLGELTRRSPEWRAARRAKRPSRATGRKSALFSACIAERNRTTLRPKSLPLPVGKLRTTKEISRTLRTYRGRANHAIPVAGALQLPPVELPIDPYLLGAWLGDGTAANPGFTSADPFIPEQFIAAGVPAERVKNQGPYAYKLGKIIQAQRMNGKGIGRINDWYRSLRLLGVAPSKHIPQQYLRSSVEQRIALLQGLMDTDGTVGKNGRVSFSTTRPRLRDGFCELVVSLGWKFGWYEKRAKINGRDCGPAWTINFRPNRIVFRLPRKADRQRLEEPRRTTKFRYIVECEQVPGTPMRCVSVDSPSRLYLAGRSMVPTHNSWSILFEPIRHLDNPDFGAVIFRRTYPEIRNEGGLWDESMRIYPLVKGTPKVGEMAWSFPSGASVSFGHMQHAADVLRWQGAQVPLIQFDELTHFSEYQFVYMLSRNRSMCGVTPYMRATCNPDAASWVARWVEWYIDPTTGYPIPERSGKIRWFVRDGETIRWGNSKADLIARYPDKTPKSFTFIPSTLSDNRILEAKDPSYRANLEALPRVERERLLRGNWLITSAEGEWPAEYFGRHLYFADWPLPEDRACCTIAWDPSKGTDSRYGDYSAFTILVRDNKGNLYADAIGSQRWPVEEAIDVGLELCRVWNPDGFAIEVNQFQSLVKSMFVRRAKELGIVPPVFTIDNRIRKEVRIRRLGPQLANRILRLKGESTGARILAEQLMQFPNGEHDDFVDSLEMSLRTMISLVNRRANAKRR